MIAICGVLLGAVTALAYVPNAGRLAGGIAAVNQKEERSQLLRLRLTLRSEIDAAEAEERDAATRSAEEDPALVTPPPEHIVAEAEILTDPSGLARMEVRHADGRVERHLLRGREYLASVDGAMLANPLPLLLPFPLLQAGTSEQMESLLHSFAVDLTASSLGRVGEADAFILGRDFLQAEPTEELSSARAPSGRFWVAVEGLQALRLERSDGFSWDFGELRRWGKITAPSAVTLRGGRGRTLRMEVRSVETVGDSPADLTDFHVDWLGILGEFIPQIEENSRPNKR